MQPYENYSGHTLPRANKGVQDKEAVYAPFLDLTDGTTSVKVRFDRINHIMTFIDRNNQHIRMKPGKGFVRLWDLFEYPGDDIQPPLNPNADDHITGSDIGPQPHRG